jgi:hypothetical protein
MEAVVWQESGVDVDRLAVPITMPSGRYMVFFPAKVSDVRVSF